VDAETVMKGGEPVWGKCVSVWLLEGMALRLTNNISERRDVKRIPKILIRCFMNVLLPLKGKRLRNT